MIYFDNSATTVPYPEALRTYQEVATKFWEPIQPTPIRNICDTYFGGFS